MQRKGRKYKYKTILSYHTNISNKLHSIPRLKKNVKSNVLYSIPACMLVLLMVFLLNILISTKSYAYDFCPELTCTGTVSDSSTITSISSDSSTPPTVSLSLSKPTMVSDTTTPGSIATVNTGVTVDVKNADSYTLTLKVGDATMTSGNTTITAGNVINDNTWGYKWDGAVSYTAPSTGGTSLAVPTVDSNGNSSFTKNLTFGVKFASDADAGHYKASGTLSLVANPRAAVITLADLTEMQQLAEGYAPGACENTPYIEDKVYNLTDVRDGNTYTVSKFKDGKCWMTQNLRLSSVTSAGNWLSGRVLNPTTTNITSNWTLPATITTLSSTNFSPSDYYKAESYIATPNADAGETGYYSFTAATAGWSTSDKISGNSPQSICPKGWRLPTGGSNGEFEVLYDAGGISSGNTSPWYYTGYIYVSTDITNSMYDGSWWSDTAYGTKEAYSLYLNSSSVMTSILLSTGRSVGFPIRCVAQ